MKKEKSEHRKAWEKEYRASEKRKASRKAYLIKNKEKLCQQRKERYQKNKDAIKIKESTPEAKKIIKERNRVKHLKNKIKNNKRSKQYYQERRDHFLELVKIYRQENRGSILEKARIYQKNNKDRFREAYHTNPLLRLKKIARARVLCAFKSAGLPKMIKTEKMLGAPIKDVKLYIQELFVEGMTWSNIGIGDGKWQIDHIIPLSSAKTEKDLISLCHFKNLQPLWAKDNLSKSNKIIPKEIAEA